MQGCALVCRGVQACRGFTTLCRGVQGFTALCRGVHACRVTLQEGRSACAVNFWSPASRECGWKAWTDRALLAASTAARGGRSWACVGSEGSGVGSGEEGGEWGKGVSSLELDTESNIQHFG